MIEVVRTFDPDIIKEIMFHPEIFETIADDGYKKELFQPDCDGECWLLMVNESKVVVGVYRYHALNKIMVQIHAHVLPQFREEHAKETGTAALRWLYDTHPEYLKVVAVIPTLYKNVRDFTLGFGFKEEGVNRQSYLKHGQIVDQHMLGITRDEIGAFLNV